MRREIALRFEPRSGGTVVPAKAYVATLEAVLEGLSSLRNATVPLIAHRRGWPAAQVREALQVGIAPTRKGSLLVPLVVGVGGPAAHLDVDVIAPMYWRLGTRLLRQAAAGRSGTIDLAASCADAFARAARHASEEGQAALQFAERGPASTGWRAVADLTRLEPGLRRYAERRTSLKQVRAQLLGQIVALTYDPPTFMLETSRGKRTVSMPADMRRDAQKLWGHEVLVDVDAKMTAEGELREPRAIALRPAVRLDDAPADHEHSRGILGDVWGTEEARDYLDALRRGSS